jgi:polyisoprenoid-binding protein YceI
MGEGRGEGSRLLRLAAALAALLPGHAHAAEWRVDPARSTIALTVTQSGRPLEARFTRFDAAVEFDPARPRDARVTVTVDTASFASGASQVDQAAVSREFLAAGQHPTARYVLTSLEPLGGDRYEAAANLELRGVSLPVTHPAAIEAGPAEARASGEVTLLRTAWGVGASQFPNGDQVGLEVVVRFDLRATRPPG